jgi:hypothetical protein
VPENDYNTQRISRRAAALIATDPLQTEDIRKFVTKFYDIRSRIVHGGTLSAENREWLFETIEKLNIECERCLSRPFGNFLKGRMIAATF